jgi:hypothetical protein
MDSDALQQPRDEGEGSSLGTQLGYGSLVGKEGFHFGSCAFAKSRSGRAEIVGWRVIHAWLL